MHSLDLRDLGLDRGGHVLGKRALAAVEPGSIVSVAGSAADLEAQLRAWCRAAGHEVQYAPPPPPKPVAPAP